MSVAIAETIDRPVMAYSPGEADASPRLMRGLLAAGMIHGGACAMYVVQRAARWLAGTELELEQSQSSTAAGLGLCLQTLLGFALLTSCLVALRWPSRVVYRVVAVIAAFLGAIWFAYGVADMWPMLFIDYAYERPVGIVFRTFCRESNQAIICLLLVFACARRRSMPTLVFVLRMGVVLSCVLLAAPTFSRLNDLDRIPFAANHAYYLKAWGGAAGYLLAAIAVLLVRWPWRLAAALPLVACIAKDYFVDGALSYETFVGKPTFDSVMLNLRQISFLLFVASASTACFAVFTVLGVRRRLSAA